MQLDMRYAKWAKLIAVTVFCILFAVAYKDDSAALARNRWLANTEQLSAILVLKRFSMASLLMVPIAAIIMMKVRSKLANPMSIGTASLVILFIFEVSRLAFAENIYALQMFASGMIFSAFYLITIIGYSFLPRGYVPSAIVRGVGVFSILHVLLNLVVLISGVGYHNSRFLGTTIHPNFIGVQMAVAAIFLAGWRPGRPWLDLLKIVALIGSVVCLLLSGSRTGLVVAAAGGWTYLLVSRQTLRYGLLLVIIGIAATIVGLLLYTPSLEFDQFDRGGVDTRAEAWDYLINAVNISPFFGAGELPISSENSYLRGWATVGIVYPIIFIFFTVVFVINLLYIAIQPQRDRDAATLAGCVAGLLIGGMFEGFLVDTFTPTLFVFLFSISGLDVSVKSVRSAGTSRRKLMKFAQYTSSAGEER